MLRVGKMIPTIRRFLSVLEVAIQSRTAWDPHYTAELAEK